MQVIRFSLGSLQANCYLLIRNSTCLLVDPADDAAFLLEEIKRRNLRLLGILATHGHFDHVLAGGEIQKSFPVPFYLFKEDRFLVDRTEETAKYFLGYDPIILPISKFEFLQEGNTRVGEFAFQIIKTPGHTPGSCCFYFKKEELVFTGDTIFKDGIGRSDFSYSSGKDLMESIKRILALPGRTKVYSGHAEETSISSAAVSIQREFGS